MTTDARPDPMTDTSAATTSRRLRPAIFLDRDGTMNEDVGYLSELSHLTLYPWTVDVVPSVARISGSEEM